MSTALDLDSPEATQVHAGLIQARPFLRRIYEDNYRFFSRTLEGAPPGQVLELGSGGGFLKELMPAAITSDTVDVAGVDLVLSGQQLPFAASSLSGIVMLNVFHHLPDVSLFLDEAARCLKSRGRLLMIEPANTLMGRFIYRNFHHEPFEPGQKEWRLPPGGRMTAANDALPWIVFCRDRDKLRSRHADLRLDLAEPFMPLRYLLSGGLSGPRLAPAWSYSLILAFESLTEPLHGLAGMFMKIAMTRI